MMAYNDDYFIKGIYYAVELSAGRGAKVLELIRKFYSFAIESKLVDLFVFFWHRVTIYHSLIASKKKQWVSFIQNICM